MEMFQRVNFCHNQVGQPSKHYGLLQLKFPMLFWLVYDLR